MTEFQLLRFKLHITYEQYLQVYQGAARTISVVADNGKKVVFPAGNIQSFLTKDGIHGQFEMTLTPANKFIAIKKISPS